MASIKVVSAPFTVRLDPVKEGDPPRDPSVAESYTFPAVGTYDDVPDEAATHPYTMMHLEGYEVPPVVGDQGVVLQPTPQPAGSGATVSGGAGTTTTSGGSGTTTTSGGATTTSGSTKTS